MAMLVKCVRFPCCFVLCVPFGFARFERFAFQKWDGLAQNGFITRGRNILGVRTRREVGLDAERAIAAALAVQREFWRV